MKLRSTLDGGRRPPGPGTGTTGVMGRRPNLAVLVAVGMVAVVLLALLAAPAAAAPSAHQGSSGNGHGGGTGGASSSGGGGNGGGSSGGSSASGGSGSSGGGGSSGNGGSGGGNTGGGSSGSGGSSASTGSSGSSGTSGAGGGNSASGSGGSSGSSGAGGNGGSRGSSGSGGNGNGASSASGSSSGSGGSSGNGGASGSSNSHGNGASNGQGNGGSNGQGNGGSNGQGNGGSNGQGNGGSNGQGNGASNGQGNGGSNGQGNGGSNGQGNGAPNGQGNGGSNGQGNGASNGQGNGASNGSGPTVTVSPGPPADTGQQGSPRARSTSESSTSAVDVSITGAAPGDHLSLDVTPPGREKAPVAFEGISVTLKKGGDVSMRITNSRTALPGSPAFTEHADVLGRVRLDHSVSNAQIADVAYTFRVSKDRLDAANTVPESVALYRHAGGKWTRLQTKVVGETATDYVFHADSPGMSEFAIGAERPSFDAYWANVGQSSAAPGQPVTVSGRITNVGAADGVFQASLVVDGRVVETRDVTIAAGGTRQVNFRTTFDQVGDHSVTVDGVPAGTVAVAPPAAADRAQPATQPGMPPLQRLLRLGQSIRSGVVSLMVG